MNCTKGKGKMMENQQPEKSKEKSRRDPPDADAAPRRLAISELYEDAYRRACSMADSFSPAATRTERNDALGKAERYRTPRHPGRALREDFLGPRNLTPERLSAATGITPERLDGLLAEREPICAGVAAALARFFGGHPTFWLELQAHYDG
jgi:addiction module HigA family antidote